MSDKRTGIEELRLIVGNLDNCNESFLNSERDPFTAEQLLQIGRMHLASGWDIYPDRWTKRQVREALADKAPRWDSDEKPVYDAA